MACTIEYWHWATGATLTLQLYPLGSSSIANGVGGDTLTEDANGRYAASVAESITGVHNAYVLQSGTRIYQGFVDVQGTGTYAIDGIPGQVAVTLSSIVPIATLADSETSNAGSVISGTYADTWSANATYLILAPGGSGLSHDLIFECGTGRVPTSIVVTGWWNGTSVTHISAYNYQNAAWVQLTNATTAMLSRNNALTYGPISIAREMMNSAGQVSLRFTATSTTGANRLRIDHAQVYSLAEAVGGGSGGGATLTAQQVWEYGTRTLTDEGGEVTTVDYDLVQQAAADALAAYDAATGADISALNNLSAAQVNAEVDQALADINLDHLVGTATGIPSVPAGTFLDQIMDDGTATFDRTTDSLQAIRDRGDAAWASATSGDSILLQETTIATLASQTSFTLTAGSADNDSYNNQTIVFIDQSTSTQKAVGTVSDYVGSTRTVTLSTAPAFTIATGDTVKILATAARSVSNLVLPAESTVGARVNGSMIEVYTSETMAVSITVLDANGDARDLSALTLSLVIENHAGTVLATIADGDITVSGAGNNVATFDMPSAVSDYAGTYRWALRETTDDERLARGIIVVEDEP